MRELDAPLPDETLEALASSFPGLYPDLEDDGGPMTLRADPPEACETSSGRLLPPVRAPRVN